MFWCLAVRTYLHLYNRIPRSSLSLLLRVLFNVHLVLETLLAYVEVALLNRTPPPFHITCLVEISDAPVATALRSEQFYAVASPATVLQSRHLLQLVLVQTNFDSIGNRDIKPGLITTNTVIKGK